MCGLAGFIDHNNSSSEDILKLCTNQVSHRGPDAAGFEFIQQDDHQAGLGHRRLSVIDLSSAGSQPMWYKSLCIIFNGEIYNYQEIKDELIKLGHSFESNSDTEVILHSYEHYGAGCLKNFIGIFSIIIYDADNKKLFACRDRAGVKPLYYYYKNSLLLIGSELKTFVSHPKFTKELNINAAALYLQYGHVPTPHSIFKDTYKLKPGHYLEYDVKAADLIITQYWSVYDFYNKPELDISFSEAKTETEKILLKAFGYRMVSDVPVGIFLSGGYDSSCVAALLQQNSPGKLKTFTIGIPDAGMNEAPFAKKIASHLGTDHTEFYCSVKEAVEIVPKLAFYYDEPFGDSSAIPTCLVSRIARENVTVALSADGGDEIFAGYNRYDYMLRYGSYLKKIPSFIRASAADVMDKIDADKIPIFNNKYLFQSRFEKIRRLLHHNSEKDLFKALSQHTSKKEIEELFIDQVTEVITSFDSNKLKAENYSTLKFMMAMDYETYLPDDILQKVDRATMSVGLEGREPFLDQNIIEWAAQLPMGYKYNKGNKKFIIKEIVHKYIPKEMMDRPKMGFGVPVADWLKKELRPFVEMYLGDSFVQNQGLFRIAEVNKLKTSFLNGKSERAERIWQLLMFQMWYDRWINNNPLEEN